MTQISYPCAWCGETAWREAGQIKRSLTQGMEIYCGRQCSGEARRVTRSDDDRRAAKAAYDRNRRTLLGDGLLAKKRAAYHASVASDPAAVRAKERASRKRRMPQHVEYCRRLEYRQWKVEYDRKYHARQNFGDFAEAAIALNQLEAEITSRAARVEIRAVNGTLNKHQQRRREYERQTQRR